MSSKTSAIASGKTRLISTPYGLTSGRDPGHARRTTEPMLHMRRQLLAATPRSRGVMRRDETQVWELPVAVRRGYGRRSMARPTKRISERESAEIQLLDTLEEVARQVGVEVVHDHIRAEGFMSRGGSCRLRDRWMILLDRKMPTSDKVDLLATELRQWPIDGVFVPPAIRHLLEPRSAS
ncbi:MAG: hypothetical protein U0610_02125 [bacterium]